MAALQNEEYVYNTLLMGGDSDYAITAVEGLDDIDVREQSADKALDHGAFVEAEFLASRIITLTGYIIAADLTALAAKIDLLRRAFGPQRADQIFEFKWAGEVQKRTYAKPIRRALPRTLATALGHANFVVALRAGDPRLYAETVSLLAADGVAVNAGTFPSPPAATIVGPATNPRITNVTAGRYVEVSTTLTTGQVLEIDFAKKTIYKGGVSIYGSLAPASEWWQVEPGNNDITFTGITGTKELAWRSAWA